MTRLGKQRLPHFFLYAFLLLIATSKTPLLLHNLYTNIGLTSYLKENPNIHLNGNAHPWLASAYNLIPNKLNSVINLARFHINQNQPEKAIYLLSSPNHRHTPVSNFILGQAFFDSGQIDAAIDKWDHAGVTSKYLVFFGLQNNDSLWFNIAIKLDPSSHTYYQLAQAYKALSDNESLFKAYQKALSLDSGWDSDYERFLAHYQLALFLYPQRQQYKEDAEHQLNLVLDIAETNYPSVLPTIYLRLGTIAMENREYAKAISYFDKLVSISPSVGNYILLGKATYSLDKNIESATPIFIRAVEMADFDPNTIRKIINIITRQAGHEIKAHQRFFCSYLTNSEMKIVCQET